MLEDAETVMFPSGMAAIAAVLYSTLRSGDRVLLPSDGYYTVRLFAEKYLQPMGVAVDLCATAEAATRPLDGYKLVWLETPSNPGLDVADIAAVGARREGSGCAHRGRQHDDDSARSASARSWRRCCRFLPTRRRLTDTAMCSLAM